MEQPILNEHNKQEHPQSHTAEHLLNQTMIRMFGCGRHTSSVRRVKSAGPCPNALQRNRYRRLNDG